MTPFTPTALRAAWFALLLVTACSGTPPATAPISLSSGTMARAPTYSELYSTYFAPDTPGHCATAGCHADPDHNAWLCGTRATCYRGMVDVGLIDPASPSRSAIADPSRSPLVWVNPTSGTMPLDAQVDNSAARNAIVAWVAAGAFDD